MADSTRVCILLHNKSVRAYHLAEAAAAGVLEVTAANAIIYQVPDVSGSNSNIEGPAGPLPEATLDSLVTADAIIVGSGCAHGVPSSALMAFLARAKEGGLPRVLAQRSKPCAVLLSAESASEQAMASSVAATLYSILLELGLTLVPGATSCSDGSATAASATGRRVATAAAALAGQRWTGDGTTIRGPMGRSTPLLPSTPNLPVPGAPAVVVQPNGRRRAVSEAGTAGSVIVVMGSGGGAAAELAAELAGDAYGYDADSEQFSPTFFSPPPSAGPPSPRTSGNPPGEAGRSRAGSIQDHGPFGHAEATTVVSPAEVEATPASPTVGRSISGSASKSPLNPRFLFNKLRRSGSKDKSESAHLAVEESPTEPKTPRATSASNSPSPRPRRLPRGFAALADEEMPPGEAWFGGVVV